MRRVFSARGRAELEGFATGNVLLGFDYDGTLAPLAGHPDEARLLPSTRALLGEVTQRYPCAVVSGRARMDVLRHIDGLRLLRVVGNHGMEGEARPRQGSRETVEGWQRALQPACGALPGVWIEDKTWSLAVHYRHATRRAAALKAVLAAVAVLPGARVVHGKQVVNVVPESAANKGMAIEEICRELGCDSVIYVGDDVTDEDVFALSRPGSLLSIRVGRSSASSAGWFVDRQEDVDELLATLLSYRPALRATVRR